MVGDDEVGGLVGRGRRLLDEHDAGTDPRQAAMALSGALTAFTAARTLLEDAGPAAPRGALAEVRRLLGLTLAVRYWNAVERPEFAEDEDIRAAVWAEREDAVGLLTLGVAVLDPAAPERAVVAAKLGLLLYARFEDGEEDGRARPEDLDRAVGALRLACPVPVPLGPWQVLGGHDRDDPYDAHDAYDDQDPGHLMALGNALADRHDRDGAPADRAAADAVLTGLLGRLRPQPWHEPGTAPPRPDPATDPGPADLADQVELLARQRLARLLLDQQEDGGGDPGTADRAVAQLELIAATTGPDDPARLWAGLVLVDRYEARGGGTVRPEDAAHRLARLRDLRRLVPPEEPGGGYVRWVLGSTLGGLARLDRYLLTAEAGEAVEVLREGLAGMAEDDPVRPPSHAVLGTMVNALCEQQPDSYRLEEALHHLERAVDTMAEEDHGIRRSDILQQLAHASIARDEFSTDRAALDRVIGLLDDARARPSGSPWSEEHLDGSLAAAMSKRFTFTNAAADLDAAIRHERAAFRRAAPDDVNRVVHLENLSVSLHRRYLVGGDHQDLEASRRYTDEVVAFLATSDLPGVGQLLGGQRPMLERTRLMLEFQAALVVQDLATMGRVVAELEPLVAAVPEDDPLRLLARGDLGVVLFLHGLHAGSDRMSEALDLMTEAAAGTPPGHLYKAVLTLRAAGALVMLAVRRPFNEHLAKDALRCLDVFLAETDPTGLEGSRGLLLRASLLRERYRHARRPADAAEALAAAGSVRERMRQGTPTRLLAKVSGILAAVHRARLGPGDRRLGREFGLAGLRELAAATLLQASAEPALVLARDAASEAVTIAGWCIADREHAVGETAPGAPAAPDPGDEPHLRTAVEVLELGRGLVLHASTATTDVPDQLRIDGHHDLADEWLGVGSDPSSDPSAAPSSDPFDFDALLGLPGTLLESLPGGADIPMPDDLRRRALTALAASPAGTALVSAPPVEEIARSLRAADADALVYLLPPANGRSGQALLITAGEDGAAVDQLPLTLVSSSALDLLHAYRRAHRERQATLDDLPPRHPERIAARRRWQGTLRELCDWAGTAVMRPLLRHPALRAAAAHRAPGAPPRLVLVPFGALGGVPWHAGLLSSGLRDGGRPVRAVERAVVSYAASARQFCEGVRRPRLPLAERPVIVGDPTRDLMFAEVEAEYLHADHYPHGTLLGYVEDAEGAGTPAEVLAALPAPGRAGASVLHLACHALPSGSSPLDAYLALAPDPGTGDGDGDRDRDGDRHGDGHGRLPVGDILRQALGRPPGSPGGLVVLDACVSDHTGEDLDEALTLSSAFLAAGATGTVGSRWEVSDEMVCVLMYVFHGRLAAGDPPAEALRRAQLWALDPDRRLPPDAPPELHSLARRAPDALEVWAAFSYQGY
ncbi:CHAT domain-containing protein [Kitasatospora purpeofusca]|uniref:CHAT domain-containing protein n=1 Tax=Kitasatospora purpeofusca TaxID=67352 RepID=UPI0022528996|nr:CHAT domain-containing protein [Kitasatospora purpeofusca]MCX4758958.1 CHAT domain-containing protein [Kitasatospora purpeofusca]WSR30622.1 CHAT domain-containing protein [Kitasatospora purpeofusca]